MPTGEISVAAATAVVGYDLFGDEWFQQSPKPRALTGIGLAGSAAALDTEVELLIGTVKVGNFLNTATGAVLMDAHRKALDLLYVPPGELLHLYVTDAPATNPINCVLEWQDLA